MCMSPSSPHRPDRPAWWSRHRQVPPVEPPDGPVIGAMDEVEMERRFAAVAAGESEARDRRLAVHLQPLVQRAVPARTVEAAPGLPLLLVHAHNITPTSDCWTSK